MKPQLAPGLARAPRRRRCRQPCVAVDLVCGGRVRGGEIAAKLAEGRPALGRRVARLGVKSTDAGSGTMISRCPPTAQLAAGTWPLAGKIKVLSQRTRCPPGGPSKARVSSRGTHSRRHDRTFPRCPRADARFRGNGRVKSRTKSFRGNVVTVATRAIDGLGQCPVRGMTGRFRGNV